jgi:ABC-type phosphate/phosphonate transport system permease subunit
MQFTPYTPLFTTNVIWYSRYISILVSRPLCVTAEIDWWKAKLNSSSKFLFSKAIRNVPTLIFATIKSYVF